MPGAGYKVPIAAVRGAGRVGCTVPGRGRAGGAGVPGAGYKVPIAAVRGAGRVGCKVHGCWVRGAGVCRDAAAGAGCKGGLPCAVTTSMLWADMGVTRRAEEQGAAGWSG
ncbi:hypothetical protein GCM10028864_60740 [Microlunatus parietis]